MRVELADAGRNNGAKSIISRANNGETTVRTDCSRALLSQIRTVDFDVKEGENYKVSCDLNIGGAQGLDFAIFDTKKPRWVQEFPHLSVGESKINELFSIPKGVTNISLVFYTKAKGLSFDFTIKDFKVEKK